MSTQPSPPHRAAPPPATAAAQRRTRRRARTLALVFALPALILLGALVVYPAVFSIGRSLFDASGTHFVGADNYADMFSDPITLKAIRNTLIWVVIAPALLTSLGLILAVLVQKVRWATAFKLLMFLPMAVSFLAAGIIFRLAYDDDPDKGVLNAAVVSLQDTFQGTSPYPTARARDGGVLIRQHDGSYRTSAALSPDDTISLGMIGILPHDVPRHAQPAHPASPHSAGRSELRGVVYLDFTPGGTGTPHTLDRGERGLPGMKIEAVRSTKAATAAAVTTTADDGSFRFAHLKPGSYTLHLPASNFAPPHDGVSWLGPALVTPAIIGAYLWIWTGFAMVLIGAGLSTLPQDTLEAARMDGANEWQVFTRITIPLLAPVLTVVFVTLVINVMKVFDLVYIIAPGPVQQDATVLATQMWLVSFGGGNNQGLGSALGVLLLVLVIPAMVINVRRFKKSQR